jgi:hypothetical protein
MKPLAYPEMANMLQLVMAQDPNKTKLNPIAATEGARGYGGGAAKTHTVYWRSEFGEVGKELIPARNGADALRQAKERFPADSWSLKPFEPDGD